MSQGQQVFYVKDRTGPNWLMVIKTHARHHYDVPENESLENEGDVLQQSHSGFTINELMSTLGTNDIHSINALRYDMEDIVVDSNDQNQPIDPTEIERVDDDIDGSSDKEDDCSDIDSDEECDEDIAVA
ncbi:hypothetical protein vseg_011754 [Gypsophila vaccaria]